MVGWYFFDLIMFQSAHYKTIFERHQLGGFTQLWHHTIDWFEEPNYRRGGWSGVGQLVLSQQGCNDLSVFVKKQQNHGRQTLWHPFSGEPTFRREFERLKYLEQKSILAPKVVFYGEQMIDGVGCAILITETLLDFEPLDQLTQQLLTFDQATRQRKRCLLKAIANASRRLHQSGVVHRAFYPKHIFVKNAFTQAEVAFIDLEKSRFKQLSIFATYFDLAALYRHAEGWSHSDCLYFLLHYFQTPHLTPWLKFLCRMIVKRAVR